jgi:hypothetical protein
VALELNSGPAASQAGALPLKALQPNNNFKKERKTRKEKKKSVVGGGVDVRNGNGTEYMITQKPLSSQTADKL